MRVKTSFKTISAALMIAVFLLIPSIASSHEPSSISLNYNAQSKQLNVIVYHYSFDVTVDYIKTVDISINSKPFQTFTYSNQYDKTAATYTYQIDAKPGDVIEVTATSTGTGSKTASITVGS